MEGGLLDNFSSGITMIDFSATLMQSGTIHFSVVLDHFVILASQRSKGAEKQRHQDLTEFRCSWATHNSVDNLLAHPSSSIAQRHSRNCTFRNSDSTQVSNQYEVSMREQRSKSSNLMFKQESAITALIVINFYYNN